MGDLGENDMDAIRVYTSLGELKGLMTALTSQFGDMRKELRGGLNEAHGRMDKIEENVTSRLNSHADDIKILRSDVDTAKGRVRGGWLVACTVGTLIITIVGGLAWLLANSPAFTNTGVPLGGG